MKRRPGGRDEEIVATVVLAVIVFGIVIGSALYTQAQLDAAAEIAVAADVPQPQAETDLQEAQQRDDPAFEVRPARQRVFPASRVAIR